MVLVQYTKQYGKDFDPISQDVPYITKHVFRDDVTIRIDVTLKELNNSSSNVNELTSEVLYFMIIYFMNNIFS